MAGGGQRDIWRQASPLKNWADSYVTGTSDYVIRNIQIMNATGPANVSNSRQSSHSVMWHNCHTTSAISS